MNIQNMTSVIEPFVSSLKDLLKFKIIGYVNTGDKTQDNLINTFLLAILAFIFTIFSWNKTELLMKINLLTKRTIILDKNTKEYYRELATKEKDNLSYVSWSRANSRIMTAKITSYCFSNIERGTLDSPFIYDEETKDFTRTYGGVSDFEAFKTILKKDTFEPIYVDQNDFLCLYKQYASDMVYIAYNNRSILMKFMNMLDEIDVDKTNVDDSIKEKTERFICNELGEKMGTIYPDRTFDMFVSRHKQKILTLLDNFVKANNSTSLYGGYGTYNLGFIVHGEPGTGKTLLIKAIANYLQRDIMTIDMRNIKTRDKFNNIFVNGDRYIYCLDEFDCVQGIIQNRDNESKETMQNKKLKDLQDRQLELFKIGAGEQKKSPHIENELKQIKDTMLEIENSLTLDSVLTVLDGVNEMRGRVIIATTNYLERIDKALLRAGRFDLKLNLSYFNDEEIRTLLTLMYRDQFPENELKNILEKYKFQEEKYAPVDIIYHVTSKENIHDVINELARV
jgi:AAA+ superfamily predicted ATPase